MSVSINRCFLYLVFLVGAGCFAQNFEFVGPKKIRSSCSQSECLAYAYVRWNTGLVAGSNRALDVLFVDEDDSSVSLGRATIGSEMAVLFRFGKSAGSYRIRGRLVVPTTGDLVSILTDFPVAVDFNDHLPKSEIVFPAGFAPSIDHCSYARFAATIADVSAMRRDGKGAVYLVRDDAIVGLKSISRDAIYEVDGEVPLSSLWITSSYVDWSYFDSSVLYRLIVVTIEEIPLAIFSDSFSISLKDFHDELSELSTSFDQTTIDPQLGNGEDHLAIKFPAGSLTLSSIRKVVSTFDLDLCWGNGTSSLRLVTAYRVDTFDQSPTLSLRLPVFTPNDFNLPDDLIVYTRMTFRSFQTSAASRYPSGDYFSVGKFQLVPGAHVAVGDSRCLSTESGGKSTSCSSSKLDQQRFFYNFKSRRLQSAVSQNCLAASVTLSLLKQSIRSSDVLFSACDPDDSRQDFYLSLISNSCSSNKCSYHLLINHTYSSRFEVLCVERAGIFQFDLGDMSSSNCETFSSPSFISGAGNHIVVGEPSGTKCLSRSTKIGGLTSLGTKDCLDSTTYQLFTYSAKTKQVQTSDGTSSLCLHGFAAFQKVFPIGTCSKMFSFVYEPLTAQIVNEANDDCISDSDPAQTVTCQNASGFSTPTVSRLYTTAFSPVAEPAQSVSVFCPRPTREWTINEKTKSIRGVVAWSTTGTDPELAVRVSLIRAVGSALERYVLEPAAKNTGFLAVDRILPFGDDLYQVEVSIPGRLPAISQHFKILSAVQLDITNGQGSVILQYNFSSETLEMTDNGGKTLDFGYPSSQDYPDSVVDLFIHWSPSSNVDFQWSGDRGIAKWLSLDQFVSPLDGTVYPLTPTASDCLCQRLTTSNISRGPQTLPLFKTSVNLNSIGALGASYVYVVAVTRPLNAYAAVQATLNIEVCKDLIAVDGNQLRATSSLAGHPPGDAVSGGWVSAAVDRQPILDIIFNVSTIISSVSTQGAGGNWVTSYQLFYKTTTDADGDWLPYQYNAQIRTFSANTDSSGTVTHVLEHPIVVRALSFTRLAFSSSAGLRIKLFGCGETMSEVPSSASVSTKSPTIQSTSDSTTTQSASDSTTKGDNNSLLIYIAAGVGSFILILVILIVILVVRCRKRAGDQDFSTVISNSNVPPKPPARPKSTFDVRYTKGPLKSPSTPQYATVGDVAEYCDVDDVAVVQAAVSNCSEVKIICSTELDIGEVLGSGEFGSVCKAVWLAEKMDVAVKTLKPQVSGKIKDDFLSEASVMCACDHPHLVELLGVCIDQPARIVTELAGYGALNSYLKKRRPGGDLTIDVVRLDRQIMYAAQIAQAMIYLSNQKLVHRDLAARNVLVFSPDLVKVSDFGLSRAFDATKEYYEMKTTTKLPLRWMAPESWNYKKFTPMSDVWSFGVTFWEIMSYGDRPYTRLKPHDVASYVESGKRLPQPDHCPDRLYEIMLSCWKIEPHERVIFPALGEKLGAVEVKAKLKKSSMSTSGPVMIKYSDLEMGKALGKGAFGEVRLATWKQPNGDNVRVAVKRISAEASPKDRDAFLKEASMMSKLEHENIVRFIGVSVQPQEKGSLLVLSELVPLGALRAYVQKNDLPESVLGAFSLQIAQGMNFLEKNRIVHRDLATRNVLVASENLVKVSDFGMSKALGVTEEYYTMSVGDKLPTKWLSPEALLYKKFSSKSDVWSFGVTMWEMWSCGATPWSGVTSKDFASMLEKGTTLERPRNAYGEVACSDEIFDLMKRCWAYEATKRLTFGEIVQALGSGLRELGDD